MAEVLSSYDGPAVGMSFDPDQVLALRELLASRPRGIVAEHHYTETDWPDASPTQRHDMTHLRHFFRTQPDLSWPIGVTNCRPRRLPGSRAMFSAVRS